MKQQGRSLREPVHGVVLLDKPRGCTSQQALQVARGVLGAAKAGHTGTLDPLADGLLPLCFGAATKFAQMHLDADKEYVARVHLGVATTTCDGEGEVTQRLPVPQLAGQELRRVLDGFLGSIRQVPPLYSALKRDGKALYEYARAGEAIEVEAREVRIDAIELLGREGDILTLRVRCGKGTYIRSLARDIGEALGCGAHLAGLTRTHSGGFDITRSHSLDKLREVGRDTARSWLLPPDALVRELPAVQLDAGSTSAMLHGRTVQLPAGQSLAEGSVRLYGHTTAANTPLFLGVARCDGHELSAQRLLSTEELLTQPQ